MVCHGWQGLLEPDGWDGAVTITDMADAASVAAVTEALTVCSCRWWLVFFQFSSWIQLWDYFGGLALSL